MNFPVDFSVKQAARVCAFVGFLAFCNSLNLQFCLDDKAAILDNPDLLGNVSWSNLFKNDFWGNPIGKAGSHKSYRPLTVATFRLNYMLHELEPLGYHLVNVLLHSGVCYLYVLLCGVVFSEVWPALIAGLLFAVHPIHTEAVSGLVGRADLLCALFAIIALFCYQESLSGGTKARKRGHEALWLLASLILILCSALSKEIGITTTLVCLAYEITLHKLKCSSIRAPATFLSSLKSSAPRAVILGLLSAGFYWFRLAINQGPPPFHVDHNPAMEFPTPYRQLHWSYLCVLNVWLLLSPSQLCAEYAMGTIPPIASLTDPRNLLTLALFAGLLSLGCYAMNSRDGHHRRLLFGLCLTILPFIPATNLFFPVGFVIAERVLYIPSMGFCMIVAYGLWLLMTNTKKSSTTKYLHYLAKIVTLFLILTQSVKTYARNWDWNDNMSLFSSALRVSKTNAMMWNFVGNTHHKAGNDSQAEKFLRKAVEIEPLFTRAHVNLVRVLKSRDGNGNKSEAIEEALVASNLVIEGIMGENPHYYQTDRNVFLELARLLLLNTKRYEEALKWSRAASDQFPDWEQSYEITGKALMKLGRHSQAVTTLNKALELKEDYLQAHVALSEAHLQLGELTEAEIHLRRVTSINPGDSFSKFKLVKVILDRSSAQTTERLKEALTIALDLLKLDPVNGNLTVAIAQLHRKLDQLPQALEYLNQTEDICPDCYTVHHDKAKILQDMKRYREAEEELVKFEKKAPHAVEDILFIRGTNYLSMQEIERASELLSAALELSPDDEPTRVNYGIVLIHSKEYTKALELFRKLVHDFPHKASYSHQVSIIENGLNQLHTK